MALLTSELDLIRYELGWNELTVGAEPYIGVAAIFDRVVAPYLRSGLITSSSTVVAAAGTPTRRTLTLAAISGTNTQGDAVAVHVGDRLIIDVDSLQESATVESMSGNTVDVLLSFGHTGTYPVTVEGGEAIVRSILRNCRAIGAKLGSGGPAITSAGLKKVDEIEFFPSSSGGGSTVFNDLVALRRYWRAELCRALFGVGDMSLVGASNGGGGNISVY